MKVYVLTERMWEEHATHPETDVIGTYETLYAAREAAQGRFQYHTRNTPYALPPLEWDIEDDKEAISEERTVRHDYVTGYVTYLATAYEVQP